MPFDQNSSTGEQVEFLTRLAGAFVQPVQFPLARSLSVRCGIQPPAVEAATLITAEAVDQLHVIHTVRTSSESPEVMESRVEEPWTSLTHRETILQAAPIRSAGNRRQVFAWPDLLAALVLEQGPTTDPLEQPADAVALWTSVCRQLLGSASDHPLLFPEAKQVSAMAEFAAGAGHEINNPLGSILGQTQLLLKNGPTIDQRQSLEIIGAQAWRIRDMIGDTMLFARPPAPRFEAVDLCACAANIVQRASADLSNSLIHIDFECAESQLDVECDKVQIVTLLNHLIRNGIEAVQSDSDSGSVSVSLQTVRRRHAAELVVGDSGPGIREEAVRRHLFDPFFSGRQAGRGLGFGLSLSARIVHQHHGMLLYSPAADSRTEFHVALPLHQQLKAAAGGIG